MKLYASMILATAVRAQVSFFSPRKAPYKSVAEAEAACRDQGAHVASADLDGLSDFINNDKHLSKKKFLILAKTDGAESTYLSTSNFKAVKAKKKSSTVCVSGIDRCYPSGDSQQETDKYQFFNAQEASTVNFVEAREECQSLGLGWDLAVVDSDAELKKLQRVVDSECWSEQAFWMGFNEFNGTVQDIHGVNTTWPIKWAENEPNNKLGNDEQCVRMKEGLFNDAKCDRTWTGGPKQGIGMGYICEYKQPACVKAVAARQLEDEEYVIRPDQAVSWAQARQECKKIGKHWDLVVFNHQREINRINDIINDNCVNQFAYWTGYREYSGKAETVFGTEIKAKADGFTVSIPLPWDQKSNPVSPEPNDWQGSEECVRMRNGVMNDAICSRTWTGARRANVNMGFICERHNPCEAKRDGTPNGYTGPDYIIAEPEFISANDAKLACRANGAGWDLAVIDDAAEMKYINDKIKDGCSPYWLGMTEKNGLLYDLDRKTAVQYGVWDTHLGHGFGTQPSTPFDDKWDCVRMRGGLYNDAPCDDQTGFTKQEKMGYVCEYKTPSTPGPDEDECLPCEHNQGVLPWNVLPGCNTPNCEARIGIVDAWKIGNGVTRPVRYGFVGLIKLPEEFIDNDTPFSVLIRFSKRVTHGHFQLWNMKFWNFYNGGYEVLLHSKWFNTDRHDPYSIAFVTEEMNVEEYPEILFFNRRETKHQCFQSNMHHGHMRTGGVDSSVMEYAEKLEEKPHVDPEDVTSVKWKNGKIVYVKGKGSKKSKRL